MDWVTRIEVIWQVTFVVLVLVLDVGTSAHAILVKRDHRAAVMWVAFIWFSPLIGAVCYLLLGVNRIRRRASRLRAGDTKEAVTVEPPPPDADLAALPPHFQGLARLGGNVTGSPLLDGNEIRPLENGDTAFPVMIQAIDDARTSVSLASYIFDDDRSGRQFVEAFSRAVARGVAVRVLVDDVGARYSRPPVERALRAAGVPCAHFLPQAWYRRFAAMNMRSHRKLMVVDGRHGFVGGMNIREGNCLDLEPPPKHPIRDLHFRVAGPVVSQLQAVFVDDWHFCTGERLAGAAWFPHPEAAGNVRARVIPDGPDEDLGRTSWMLQGALDAARHSVFVVTPYFIPDQSLVAALNAAALRGVGVRIVLPATNNLRFMHWASRAGWWQLLQHGCRLWLTSGPFDHSKLLVIDDAWVLAGSANWDTRSLRLNFEVSLEAYDPALAAGLVESVDRKLRRATEVTLAAVNARSLPVRLLDGVTRLFNPFL